MGRTLFSVDVGGTFTDVVMVQGGIIHVTKVPSNDADTHLPVIEGARRLGFGTPRCSTMPVPKDSMRC
ncbi:MAG: hydantoinase/oxoprolinase N-terminal domain-containing protein [Steroidobacteraceae bacterium]